jgi:hypothetical protein
VTTHLATSAAQREYDRFGPWALEISEDDPVPPQFAAHVSRQDAILSVKVPRVIARRDAQPGMPLYDYLLSLYPEAMVVLERVGGSVAERTIEYDRIHHLSVSADLLRGRLHLAVPGAPLTLPYNTVSREVMDRVVGLIRERYRRAPQAAPAELPATVVPVELSFYFERLLNERRVDGIDGVVLLAQPDVALAGVESSPWRKLLFGLIDRRLLESLHFSNGRELEVFDRGRHFAYRWETTYGRRVTYAPLENVLEVGWEPGTAGVSWLRLTTAGGPLEWVLSGQHDAAERHVAWLRAAALSRRG